MNGKRVGLACGCFDILHLGHIEHLRFAKSCCDVLLVGVDSDASIRCSKGDGRPIHSQQVRLLQLEELRSVDHAFAIDCEIEFGGDAATKQWRALLARIRPDVLITHGQADRYSADKKRHCLELGIEIIFDEQKKVFSTTGIEKLGIADLA